MRADPCDYECMSANNCGGMEECAACGARICPGYHLVDGDLCFCDERCLEDWKYENDKENDDA